MSVYAKFAVGAGGCTATEAASRWVTDFYSDVTMVLGMDAIELRSDRHDVASLNAMMAAALATERLLERRVSERESARRLLAR